jgi:hypothetical protein
MTIGFEFDFCLSSEIGISGSGTYHPNGDVVIVAEFVPHHG